MEKINQLRDLGYEVPDIQLDNVSETTANIESTVDDKEKMKLVKRSVFWDKNAPNRNSTGTRNYGGGLTWVGEQGPELLKLPQGSEILNNNRSMKLHDIVANPSAYLKNNSSLGGGKVININGPINLPNVSDANGFINQLMQIGNKGVVSFS